MHGDRRRWRFIYDGVDVMGYRIWYGNVQRGIGMILFRCQSMVHDGALKLLREVRCNKNSANALFPIFPN